ncbi:hypothetical protein HanIR_Chr05g0245651 [Helianthus annuus]|nr:hypothetical protein HanIR_Chr05g0245651 [Helianthus annuus]
MIFICYIFKENELNVKKLGYSIQCTKITFADRFSIINHTYTTTNKTRSDQCPNFQLTFVLFP